MNLFWFFLVMIVFIIVIDWCDVCFWDFDVCMSFFLVQKEYQLVICIDVVDNVKGCCLCLCGEFLECSGIL